MFTFFHPIVSTRDSRALLLNYDQTRNAKYLITFVKVMLMK